VLLCTKLLVAIVALSADFVFHWQRDVVRSKVVGFTMTPATPSEAVGFVLSQPGGISGSVSPPQSPAPPREFLANVADVREPETATRSQQKRRTQLHTRSGSVGSVKSQGGIAMSRVIDTGAQAPNVVPPSLPQVCTPICCLSCGWLCATNLCRFAQYESEDDVVRSVFAVTVDDDEGK
jgi:hypothetical protein